MKPVLAVGRDGKTPIEDVNEFGQEWQVLEEDGQLFHTYEGAVQAPQQCILPDALDDGISEGMAQLRGRRLGEDSVTTDQAEEACAHLEDPAEQKACIYDVLATQDLGMAGAW